jgi:hypothetical protein
MRRIIVLAATVALVAVPSAVAEPRKAPDCRFEGARSYEDFGRIRTFTTSSGLFGCLTDVGRAYRLDTGTLRARSSATRGTLFGAGDWVGFQSRTRKGDARARALNLRTGRTHAGAASAPVTALVVNYDGTLAWIAGTSLRSKATGGRAQLHASDRAIDRRFLGLENDRGCAVTWRLGGEQRSSSLFCSTP